MELIQEIYTDPDYQKIIRRKYDLYDKIKKIILKHELVNVTEFDDLVKRNMGSPEMEEIFNILKDFDEDFKTVMRKYESKIKWLIIPIMIFDFVNVNVNLFEQKQH